MFEAVFREAGLPEGLLQVVVGDAEVGEAIVTDPNVAGRVVHRLDRGRPAGRRAGRRRCSRSVSLELGGNNAFIVLDDADLDAAAAAGAFASFQFQGQVCFAAGPPHRPPRASPTTYIDAPAPRRRRRLRLGDPYREDVELGPIVNEKQLERVDGIVRRSVAAAARGSSTAARTRACSTGRPCWPT